ncbi:sodium:alanine symporter family protein, partial [Mesorhizobium sp. M00.F.Ca.ET.186.01.1.1]
MQQFLLDVTASINDFFWSYVLIVMLVVLGLFFSFKGRFLQIRMIKDMLQAIREGKKGSADSISPFQAFCISMAAR